MIGSNNPLPTQIGGSPSPIEKVYRNLQEMVGKNGYNPDDESLEAQWRQAKAEALACIASFDERAALQAFPNVATDHIPLYEEMLGIASDTTLSDEERRQVIVPDYTGTPQAWTSAVAAQVAVIDSRIIVITRDWANSGTTQPSKAYEEYIPVPDNEYDPGGSRRATQFPNPSEKRECILFFDIGNGVVPSRTAQRHAVQAKKQTREICPAYVSVRLIYAIGFTLDQDLLDATGFGK